jgi:predicted dehydrogenase
MINKIDLALIGHGYWGSKLLSYFQKDRHFVVRHVCDSKTDLTKVWPDVEAVMVATPIDSHFQVVKTALEAGKHVFTEKPLATKTKRCLELQSIARKKKLSLVVEYTQSFSRSLQKAAREIDVGQIQAIEMSVKHLGRFLNRDVYWLLASHCLSILDMFVPLEELEFKRRDWIIRQSLAESGQILFSNRQIKGSISLSLNFPGQEYRVIVYGQKGTITYDPQAKSSLRAVWYQRKKGALPPGLIQKEKSWQIDEANNLKHAVDYFYQVLTKKEKSNLTMAIKVTNVLENLSVTSF